MQRNVSAPSVQNHGQPESAVEAATGRQLGIQSIIQYATAALSSVVIASSDPCHCPGSMRHGGTVFRCVLRAEWCVLMAQHCDWSATGNAPERERERTEWVSAVCSQVQDWLQQRECRCTPPPSTPSRSLCGAVSSAVFRSWCMPSVLCSSTSAASTNQTGQN